MLNKRFRGVGGGCGQQEAVVQPQHHRRQQQRHYHRHDAETTIREGRWKKRTVTLMHPNGANDTFVWFYLGDLPSLAVPARLKEGEEQLVQHGHFPSLLTQKVHG